MHPVTFLVVSLSTYSVLVSGSSLELSSGHIAPGKSILNKLSSVPFRKHLDLATLRTRVVSNSREKRNDEDAHRLKIMNVIENDLTTMCKTVVLSQMKGKENETNGCKEFQENKALAAFICSTEDLQKLENVLCEKIPDDPAPPTPSKPNGPTSPTPPKSDVTATIGSTSTKTSQTEQHRQKVMNVIENDLTAKCKAVVLSQMKGKENETNGCKEFQKSKALATLICTPEDVQKLENVLCEKIADVPASSTPSKPNAPASSTSPKPDVKVTVGSTSTKTSQTELHRQKVMNVIENELAEKCKTAVQLQMTGNEDEEEGCKKFQENKALAALICTPEDVQKLENVLCEKKPDVPASPTPSKSNGPTSPTPPNSDVTATVKPTSVKTSQTELHRQKVMNFIENELTGPCKKAVQSQMTGDEDEEEGCKKFQENKELAAMICSDEDVHKLENVLCEKLVMDRIKDVIQNDLTVSCKTSVSAIMEAQPDLTKEGACTMLETQKETILLTKICTKSDIAKLEEVICDIKTDIGEQNIITDVMNLLTDRCKRTMKTGTAELSKSGGEGCQTLESTKKTMLGSNICTVEDFAKLEIVVCKRNGEDDSDLLDALEQRGKIVSIMDNELSTKCSGMLRANMYTGNLEIGCERLKSVETLLVSGNKCTQEEIKKLQPELCKSPGNIEMSEAERKQRDHIESVINNDVTPSCKTTMAQQIEAQKKNSLESSCATYVKNKSVLLAGICTAEDYEKIKDALCTTSNPDGVGRLSVSLSTFLLCSLLSFLSVWR